MQKKENKKEIHYNSRPNLQVCTVSHCEMYISKILLQCINDYSINGLAYQQN